MNTIITDGGRDREEHRDCTVRALSIAQEIPYHEAHNICAFYGRKNRRGFHCASMFNKLFGRPIKRTGSVGKFVESNIEGRFVVQIRGHAFAVINGSVADIVKIPPKCHINRAWAVKKRSGAI